jgi:TonB family protein
MKLKLPILLLLFVSTLLGDESKQRATTEVAGKSYPLYQCFSEVKPIKMVNPQYPISASSSGKQGLIIAGALVNEKGRTVSVVVLKSDASHDLQTAVLNAVKQWQFPKMQENNTAIAYVVAVPISMGL